MPIWAGHEGVELAGAGREVEQQLLEVLGLGQNQRLGNRDPGQFRELGDERQQRLGVGVLVQDQAHLSAAELLPVERVLHRADAIGPGRQPARADVPPRHQRRP